MAWKPGPRLCCAPAGRLLLHPGFLLFLLLSVMMLMLPLPRPPFHVDQRWSRSLSSTGRFRPGSRAEEPLQPAAHLPRQASNAWRSASKQPVVPGNGRKRAGARRSSGARGNTQERKETAGANRHPNRRPAAFTGSDKEAKQRWKPGRRGVQIHVERSSPDPKLQGNAPAPERRAGKQVDGRTDRRSGELARLPGESGAVGKQQLAVEKAPGDLEQRRSPSEDPATARKNPSLLEGGRPSAQPGPKGGDGEACPRITERHFSAADRRRVRVSPDLRPLPWFSEDDLHKMVLLAGGEVLSKAKLPAHGQVLQVALAPNQQGVAPGDGVMPNHGGGRAESQGQHCQRGFCSLVKRTDDWFEVFAFHLDRVLGLNRSLPAVLRTFQSQILPYRYISGVPRPVVWWDPDIQHLASRDNDQNSVPLSWVQYQKLLQSRCGIHAGLWAAPCVGIRHSEWGRLALFDFLLQVNDRLDRYCCGFWPDPTEPCVENMLRAKCGSSRDLLLVHILVRKADPSRLVFIDNSGRPHQATDNLNFQLLEGIDEFPERAVSVLRSGCLESLLLRSLYTDREFWESQGGADGLRPLIRSVEHRGKVLLRHIRDKKLQLKSDL